MKNPFSAIINIHISASPSQVWKALTDPSLIKQYLHGTNASSDWKPGSPLIFKGNWQGKEYLDKGIIIDMKEDRLLRYSWLSFFSGLEDKEENYSIITYELKEEDGGTGLRLTQNNIASEEGKQNSEKNWSKVLIDLKALLEK